MRIKILFLFLLFLASIFLVIALHIRSLDTEEHDFQRDFTREIHAQKILTLDNRFYYIAGFSDDSVYLGNSYAPFRLWSIAHTLHDYPHIFRLPRIPALSTSIHIQLDSGIFFMNDLKHYKIYRGDLSSLYYKPVNTRQPFFAEAIPLSNHSVIVREIDNRSRRNVLSKYTTYDSIPLTNPGLLEKQLDGIFCTDGVLHFNKTLNVVVYLYYYRNQFIVMDTMLNLIHRSHTIDPITRARIKTSTTKNGKAVVLASPPYMVNRLSAISGHYLFVASSVKSKSETRDFFDRHSIIDVYNMLTGSYISSFYIPDYHGHTLRALRINGSSLYALHDSFLIVYGIEELY